MAAKLPPQPQAQLPRLLAKIKVILSISPNNTDPKYNTKEFKDFFLKKLQFCTQALDFNDDSHDIKEKVFTGIPNNTRTKD